MVKNFAAALLLFVALSASPKAQGPDSSQAVATGANVLLVVNNASDDSRTIGSYYAVKRSVPAENVCHIHTEPKENISRETFQTEILDPVAACLSERSLQDRIQYIATTKGVPLTVLGDSGPVGDLASVDSELTLLYSYLAYGRLQTFGRIENPYFAPSFDDEAIRPFNSAAFGVYLVTRLTGLSSVDVIFMIDRAVAAKPAGGFHFDLPSARETAESEWIDEAASRLAAMKREVQVENSAAPLADPRPVMGYCSLGGSDPNFDPDLKITWSPGALAIALDRASAASFLASPEADPTSEWAAKCIASGATGFGGHVADPTLDGQIRPQIVFPAYASGYNLAESFYLGLRYLSWREVVVGDPLTAPFGEALLALRRKYPVPSTIELDPETGLPVEFGKRRAQYLIERFATTAEAVRPLLKAEALRDHGRLAEAIPHLSRSVTVDPQLIAAHLLLAKAFTQTGQFQSAFDHYKKAIDLGDTNEETYRDLARLARERLKDPALAEPYGRWLLTRFGSSRAEVLQLWADIQFDLGKLDEAEAYYARLVRSTEPPMAAALAGLGRIQHRKGNWLQAKELLESALARLDEGSSGEGGDGESKPSREDLQKLLTDCELNLEGRDAPEERPSPEPAVETDGDIQPARILSRVLPEYPSSAKEARLEGTVVLRLLIDEQGQVVKIKRVYGEGVLAKAFEKAVRQWRFSPRLVRGVPEPSWLTVPLRFKLKTNP